MENAYGIGITNRYAMFIDDDERDPLDILKEAETDKNKVKKVEGVKPTAKVAPKAVAKKEPAKKENDNSGICFSL